MAEGEKFDIGKFISSFFQAVPWMKNLRYILGLVIVIIVGITIWRAWFMSRNPQTNTDTYKMPVIALPGSHITYTPTINDMTSQKQEEKKRAWWMPGAFVEIYGLAERGSDWQRTGVGTKGGLRWDF